MFQKVNNMISYPIQAPINSHQNMISERKLAEQTLLWEQELQETKQKNALYRLDLGLKQINRELKLTKYGSKYHFGYTAGVDVWFDYLLTELPKLRNILIDGQCYSQRT